MNYLELIENFRESDNPLVKKMVNDSQEVVESYRKLFKSNMTEREKINYILRRSIVEIAYRHSNGETTTYRCTSNPYFIALLSTRKFSEFVNVAKLVTKDLSCRRNGHFATWDLVRNRRIELVTMKTKWNPFNAIRLRLSKDSIELINQTFKRLVPRKGSASSDRNDIKELFGT